MRGSGHKTSCNLTMRVTYFVLEQGQHSYSCSLVPRPTSSFDCLQCVKQIMASYPGPGYNSPISNTLPPPPPPPQYLPMQKYWCSVLIQTLISHCKILEVNLTQKRSSQLQSGFIIQFKMGYLSCRIYTTSHFYHSVVLQCLCTQSSNMA